MASGAYGDPARATAEPPSPSPSPSAGARAPLAPPAQGRPPNETSPRAFGVGVLTGPDAGLVVLLDASRDAWTIGRDPQSDVALPPACERLSRRHAVLRRRGPEGLLVVDPGSAGGTRVEGCTVGPEPVPLSRGAVLALGPDGDDALLVVHEASALDAPRPLDLVLRRADGQGARVRLDVPLVLGRGPQAAPLLTDRDARASALHARIVPRLGQVVVEDVGSANGTWLDGRRVRCGVLRPGSTLGLGGASGPGVATFAVEVARAARASAALGRSLAPIGDQGDARRGVLEVRSEGALGRLFLFAGTRLRFGRNRARDDGSRENDLLLRAFPRAPNEAAALVQERTRQVSGRQGALLLTQDGVAVRDEGSTFGTKLDGRALAKGELAPLGETWLLDVAGAVLLRGRVFRSEVDLDLPRTPGLGGGHPVAAVRLERTRDGGHHAYVWVVREVGLGSGPEDALALPAHEGVLPGHARLGLRESSFVLTPTREDARVEVAGQGPIAAGVHVALEPGAVVRLGGLELRYREAADEDMIPPRT